MADALQGEGKPLHVVVAVGEVGEEGEEEAETCGDGEGAWQTWGVASVGACPLGEEGVFWEEGVHSSCWEEVPSGDRVASGTGKTQSVDTTKHKPVVHTEDTSLSCSQRGSYAAYILV